MVAPNSTPIAKFPLGDVVATPRAIEALSKAGQGPAEFFARHVVGDWGEVCLEDGQANNLALLNGERLLSAYRLKDGTKMWIITEADRSVSTLLLPDEY